MTIPKSILGFSVPQVVSGVVTAAFFVAMLYLSSVFATHKEVEEKFLPVFNIPARVNSLEEWRLEQKASQKANDAQFSAIREELSAIRTLQAEKAKNDEKNFDRILFKLDRIDRPK